MSPLHLAMAHRLVSQLLGTHRRAARWAAAALWACACTAQANDVHTSFTLGMSPGGDAARFGMMHSDALPFTDTIVVHGITGPVLFTGEISVDSGSFDGWSRNEHRIVFESISFNGVLLEDPDGDQVWRTPGVMTFAGGSAFVITLVGRPNVPPSGIVPSGLRDYGGRFDILPLPVPEPSSWALMATGLAVLAARCRRQRARDQTSTRSMPPRLACAT